MISLSYVTSVTYEFRYRNYLHRIYRHPFAAL